MSAIVLPCAICQLHHPTGPCVGQDGPVRVHCAQCGRRHMPSMRCKCRICGFYHPVASPCGNVRSNGSSDVYVGAAFSRDAVTAFDGGLPSESCPHCGALFFVSEAKYINCCHDGTIVLSRPSVPDALMTAITDSHVHACIRQYNSALAMASVGYSGDAMDRNHSAEPHRPHVDGWGSLKISGRAYHRIGGIQAAAEQAASWGQIYMFDAAEATQRRLAVHRCAEHLRPSVLSDLHALLLQHNPWIAEFVAVGAGPSEELSWSSDDVNTRAGIVAVVAATGVRSIIVRKRSDHLVTVFPTFESAARARGMLSDDSEIIAAFQEIVQSVVNDSSIRRQFVLHLVFCRPVQPADFFARFMESLFPPGCDVAQVWEEMAQLAIEFRISWAVLGIHPPIVRSASVPLLESFDPVLCGEAADTQWERLNEEQRQVAEAFLAAVYEPRGEHSKVFMLQASGGCGKSFVANYIAARVRSRGAAAICVAASAQAAAVLAGGRTAHGQLRIPIECDEGSYLDLRVNEYLAKVSLSDI
jgi:hypothetical protein